jgi:hypothetical protein
MKSGAEVLVAAVRVTGEALRVPFLFPLSIPLNFPLPAGACLAFIAVFFFFDTPDVGDLAAAFLAGAFLVPAMA